MWWKFWISKKKIPLCPHDTLADIVIPPCTAQPLIITVAEIVKESDLTKRPLPLNACEKCGACCAFFPVNFPDIEKDDLVNGALLNEMSLPAGYLLRVMRGTECKSPRCAALEGEVGKRVRCIIYAGRPSTCRNFNRSWEKNIGNTLCDRARAVYGMQPFSQY
jgi:Fe-S-cluster containining protein